MNSSRNFRLRTIALAVFIWLFTCGLLLLMVWPRRPSTYVQWLLFILLGPMAYGAVEYAGERILSPKLAARISPRRFSWLRIGYALVAFLVFLAALVGVVLLFGGTITGHDAMHRSAPA
jgi:hypothetical protein